MLLAEQGLQKKERCCATNYVGQHTAHMYKLNLMIRHDSWSLMQPQVYNEKDGSVEQKNLQYVHLGLYVSTTLLPSGHLEEDIECTLNAH